MGFCKSSVRNIILKYKKDHTITKGQRGGSKSKLSAETREAILDKLDAEPFTQLRAMATYLKEYDGTNCCVTTISKFLNKQMLSFTTAKKSVDDKNSLIVKTLRKEYVSKFMKEVWRMREVVYFNECGFNMWLRSRKGSMDLTQRGPRIRLVMAIGKRGPIHFELRKGSFSKETYDWFIEALELKLDKDEKFYLINDNAALHSDVSIGNPNHKICILPPYSSFLNPTNAVFAKLKSHIRKEMTIKLEMHQNATPEQKISFMVAIIAREIQKSDYMDMAPFFRSVKKYILPSYDMEDILDD